MRSPDGVAELRSQHGRKQIRRAPAGDPARARLQPKKTAWVYAVRVRFALFFALIKLHPAPTPTSQGH